MPPPMPRPPPAALPPGAPGPVPGPVTPPAPGNIQPQQPPGLVEALRQAGIQLPPDHAIDEPKLGRKSPRGSYDHVYEVVAHELALWLDTMPKILATAMKGGPHRQGPFKHAATGKQKYEVYKAKLFQEDGSPNMQGRQELLRKMNPKQYAEVVHVVTRQMRRESGSRGIDSDE